MAGKLLLIEDEANIAEAIRFILSRDGWQVALEGDGLAAMASVAREKPDLVILDMMLPGRSGLEILADLRGAAATEKLPVLMLTARGGARDREAAERGGASAFMTKPFANDQMRAAVRALMGVPK
jgi:DNA-binding response OmpR family regulator